MNQPDSNTIDYKAMAAEEAKRRAALAEKWRAECAEANPHFAIYLMGARESAREIQAYLQEVAFTMMEEAVKNGLQYDKPTQWIISTVTRLAVVSGSLYPPRVKSPNPSADILMEQS